MIKRNAEAHLGHWYSKSHRKPLVLRGARQVGKSTLVRQFAALHGLALDEINLEKQPALDRVFKTLDIQKILMELEGLLGRKPGQPNSLLFLDEVQATPHALAALRYFYEELPELPVIAAGSLLEFALAKHAFSMPVGRVEYYHVGPISFREFTACTDPALVPWMEAAVRFEAVPETAHRQLLARLREFFFVGGMPEAVQSFIESGSHTEVREVHRSIAETYQDDFSKYAQQGDLARLQRVYQQIPRNIGRKIKYTNLSREERAREIKACVELLCRAEVCRRVTGSYCSGVPLAAEVDDSVFKLIFMDVGLVNHLCGGRWSDLADADAGRLVNEGPLAEQFVGQHLAYLSPDRPSLHYWLREGRANNAEVDYVVSQGPEILPIEVKSGAGGSLKSLQQFVVEKGSCLAVRFDTNPASKLDVFAKASTGGQPKEVSFTLVSLPLYAVEYLSRLDLSKIPAG